MTACADVVRTGGRVLAIAACALLAIAAPLAHARSSDRSKPMDIEAGHSDYSLDDSRPAVLSGGVIITQGSLDIRSDSAVITQRGGEPVRIVLKGGPVRLKQQLEDGTPMSASAANVDYDVKSESVVFTGNVSIQQPRGSLSGARVVYNMRTGQVTSGGSQGGGGRVKMRIMPRNAPASTPPASDTQGGG